MRVWFDHPWAAMRAITSGESHEIFSNPKLAREILFCSHTPEPIVQAGTKRVEPDSMRAVFLGQIFRLPKPRRITTPLLVLGGEDDGLISNDEVRATARAYRTDAEFFPKTGHMMMTEPGWADVAQRIYAWLGTHDL
jgi:pimeloyl-ACP methyl ester carboxylesterase